MARVFLSYDHDDFAMAKSLASALGKSGHTVWYDRHIHGGAQFSQKIEKALNEADAVIVLWSPNSLDSAWVRDEAAEGRDRNKLVPLSLGSVSPPMGFRQYQTIDLGAWKGRGRVPRLAEILDAIGNQAELPGAEQVAAAVRPATHAPLVDRQRPRWMFPALALLLLAAAGFGLWKWLGGSALPMVEVAAGDRTSRSQSASSDLFVKLGTLAQIGEGKWQLVDAGHRNGTSDYIFRTSETIERNQPKATLVLLDGKANALLWSREFTVPAGADADLRQQIALTAGRALRCMLDARNAGGLPRDLLKLYLNGCTLSAEAGYEEPAKIADLLRRVVKANPNFEPAWGPLISSDLNASQVASFENIGSIETVQKNLAEDVRRAEAAFPDLPELAIAKAMKLPPTAFGEKVALLEKATAKSPDHVGALSEMSSAYMLVGRNQDAIRAARRAAELDPLSPAAQMQVVLAIAYAGAKDDAMKELATAEKVWSGTGALRDAMWGFHMRFGDPKIAKRYSRFSIGEELRALFAARTDPSPANVHALVTLMQSRGVDRADDFFVPIVQSLGEFGRLAEIQYWIGHASTDALATNAYVFFRPHLDVLRRDPSFMALAARIKLADYWKSSGKWPDFCQDATLPYDCKVEAAKYVR